MSNRLYSSDNSNSTFLSGLGLVFGGLILTAILFFYSVWAGGFIGMKLWSWYVVPVFGFKTLSIIQAWGVSLLIGLWAKSPNFKIDNSERTSTDKIGEGIAQLIYPWIVFLFGWLGTFLL